MKITTTWLKQNTVCVAAYKWWLRSKTATVEEAVERLIKEGRLDWAEWVIKRALKTMEKIKYALLFAPKKEKQEIKECLTCFRNCQNNGTGDADWAMGRIWDNAYKAQPKRTQKEVIKNIRFGLKLLRASARKTS